MSRAVRAKWVAPGKAGATYIDLFSGTGKARIRSTGEWIDGSCVAAWKMSVKGNAPFSAVYIGDADDDRRTAAAQRLRKLGAPVVEVLGTAAVSVKHVTSQLRLNGLHFAFLDPYNLGAFDFSVVKALSAFDRIDMLVHISKMDLLRNVGANVAAQQSAFDSFAPGWRSSVRLGENHKTIRRDVLDHWRSLVSAVGVNASTDMQLIKGNQGQHLYWLLLAAKHDLALQFWKTASNPSQQRSLF